MVHSIIDLNVHFNISVIHLVVITQVSSHSVGNYQGMPSVCAKLTNTIWDAYKPSWVCYGPLGDMQKLSISLLVTTASPVCT